MAELPSLYAGDQLFTFDHRSEVNFVTDKTLCSSRPGRGLLKGRAGFYSFICYHNRSLYVWLEDIEEHITRTEIPKEDYLLYPHPPPPPNKQTKKSYPLPLGSKTARRIRNLGGVPKSVSL